MVSRCHDTCECLSFDLESQARKYLEGKKLMNLTKYEGFELLLRLPCLELSFKRLVVCWLCPWQNRSILSRIFGVDLGFHKQNVQY